MVKTYGFVYTERFFSNNPMKITFSLPLSEIIKNKDLVITLEGLKYEETLKLTPNMTLRNNLVNVDRIIYTSAYDNHFLLEESFPFDFITNQFKISKLVDYFLKK